MKLNILLLLAAAAVPITMLIHQHQARKKKLRNRRFWTQNWLLRRQEDRGVLNMVENELREEYPEAFRQFLRMCGPQFDELLHRIREDIQKNDTNMRECISAKQRLALTLRFLATGETYRSLMFSTRISESTISLIIPEVCTAIYENLKDEYLKMPSTESDWLLVEKSFNNLWSFPFCIGAIDGKHIAFRAPLRDGSYYYNYLGHHSIVLLAVADANYKFLYIDVGVNGRTSDGGAFKKSSLKEAIDKNILNFPPDQCLPGQTSPVSYTFVTDEAFALSKRFIKPYASRGLTNEKRIFNFRLSHARRVVENAFGIMSNRFRILLITINLSPMKVQTITLTCCVLLIIAVDY